MIALSHRHTGQKWPHTGYYLSVVTMNRSSVLQQVDLDRRRAAPAIVSALLGAVILTDVTQVFGRVRVGPGPWTPWNQSAGAPMPLRSGAAAKMTPPLENHGPPGRSLVLTGIIAYADPRQGFAIIGSSAQDTYLARPGDRLPDGALIREIYPKQVVLEFGGRLETVGIYERAQTAGTAYVQIPPPIQIPPVQIPPPLPQQARGEETDLKGVTAGSTIPSHAPRAADEPPSDPRLSDTRASESAGNERRSYDTQSSDTLQSQAQPQAPSPSAQDPADEFGDDRRQRAERRRK